MTEYEAHVRATLKQTEQELSMSRRQWEGTFGMPWPGPGYLQTLSVQLKRYRDEATRLGIVNDVEER